MAFPFVFETPVRKIEDTPLSSRGATPQERPARLADADRQVFDLLFLPARSRSGSDVCARADLAALPAAVSTRLKAPAESRGKSTSTCIIGWLHGSRSLASTSRWRTTPLWRSPAGIGRK